MTVTPPPRHNAFVGGDNINTWLWSQFRRHNARSMADTPYGLHITRSAAYYGTARVALDQIRFDETDPDARTVDPDAVARLLKKFKEGQCDRLEPSHYMSATVSDNMLKQVLKRGEITRDSLLSTEPPLLPLIGDKEVVVGICGIHRYKAAQQHFSDDRWWTVKLYSEQVLSQEARRMITWSKVLSDPWNSCEVYRRIRLAHHHEDWDWKQKWKNAVRSEYLQKDIRRLQDNEAHVALRDALDALLCYPGLWLDLTLPFFHNLGGMRCMEPCVSFLHVMKTRLDSLLDGLNPQYLDVGTVRFLQRRCPAWSEQDRREIEENMKEKRIFSNVRDGEERDGLTQRLLAQDTMILSLESWRDAIEKYLRPGASMLNPLFDPSSPTQSQSHQLSLQQAAHASFRPPRIWPSTGSGNQQYWNAYRSLWVETMAHLVDSPRDQSGNATARMDDLARAACKLGFSSNAIWRSVSNTNEARRSPMEMALPSLASSRSSRVRIGVRSATIHPRLQDLRAFRDRFTFDQLFLQVPSSGEPSVAFETFRDAVRSFFPDCRPPSATFERSDVRIDALIDTLTSDRTEWSLVPFNRASDLWSTDSSRYSRDVDGPAEPRFSADCRRPRWSPHQSQQDSGPIYGLPEEERRGPPELVKLEANHRYAAVHPNGAVQHITSPRAVDRPGMTMYGQSDALGLAQQYPDHNVPWDWI